MEEEDFSDGDGKFWSNWSTDYFENLDTSEYPFPNTLWHNKPAWEIAYKTSLMLIIGICGLFFNSVILLIIIKSKWLWCATNYLIANLALVDFLTLLLCPWFMLVRDFYQNYVLRNFGCRFEGLMQASLLIASVGALMLVSYDRLAAAALSVDARVTKSAAPKLIIITWVCAVALSLPWAIKREFVERHWLDHIEMYCREDVQVLGIYWHFTLMLLVWIPLGAMLVTYGAIMWRLECSVRELSSRGGGRVIAKAKRRALRITACVLLTGIVCRVPYTALVYWGNNLTMEINAVDGSFSQMWFAANYLMYLNCTINPLIYGFTNIRFKKAMDRTNPVAWCKFGTWCCVCPSLKRKQIHLEADDRNTERIFVIETSPRPHKKLKRVFQNMLLIKKDTIDLSVNKNDEVTTKPTKITPLKPENV